MAFQFFHSFLQGQQAPAHVHDGFQGGQVDLQLFVQANRVRVEPLQERDLRGGSDRLGLTVLRAIVGTLTAIHLASVAAPA